jgi:uncharacterized protein YhaN
VSDLLFGFPVRSPYNFMYDYSLLRVGAVLEDEGATLTCRRKKAPNASLLGSDDRPIDEGPLLAMLKGQTRETFGLSFSLDQEGLRAGGKAMVEARNDLGRALFAAGSGLTESRTSWRGWKRRRMPYGVHARPTDAPSPLPSANLRRAYAPSATGRSDRGSGPTRGQR